MQPDPIPEPVKAFLRSPDPETGIGSAWLSRKKTDAALRTGFPVRERASVFPVKNVRPFLMSEQTAPVDQISAFPVISAGCGNPRIFRIVGATSARMPSATVASGFSETYTQGTGFSE